MAQEKGWIMHEIIRTPNLNAPSQNMESSDINYRDKKSQGVMRKRAASSDETNCSQRVLRVTDIQRDLKEYQGRKGPD